MPEIFHKSPPESYREDERSALKNISRRINILVAAICGLFIASGTQNDTIFKNLMEPVANTGPLDDLQRGDLQLVESATCEREWQIYEQMKNMAMAVLKNKSSVSSEEVMNILVDLELARARYEKAARQKIPETERYFFHDLRMALVETLPGGSSEVLRYAAQAAEMKRKHYEEWADQEKSTPTPPNLEGVLSTVSVNFKAVKAREDAQKNAEALGQVEVTFLLIRRIADSCPESMLVDLNYADSESVDLDVDSTRFKQPDF